MSTPATDIAPLSGVIESTVAAIANAPLTLADRCCACPGSTSQAFVRVLIIDEDGKPGEILLCGHHYTQHEAALAARATVTGIQDERHKINDRPS